MSATAAKRLSNDHVITRVLAVTPICAAALLLRRLFTRIGQPHVLGEIVAGIALGPSVLGALSPPTAGYLFPRRFPAEVIGVLRVMAQFGLVLFMFLVGLRLNLRTCPEKRGLAPWAKRSGARFRRPFCGGLPLAPSPPKPLQTEEKFTAVGVRRVTPRPGRRLRPTAPTSPTRPPLKERNPTRRDPHGEFSGHALRLTRGLGREVVLISHVSIAFPFASGVVVAILLYPWLGSGSFVGFTLFMGAAIAITEFPVLARILTETGFDQRRIGVLSITCAAVDDATAWCLLAVVTAVVRSRGWPDVARTILLSAAFGAVTVFHVRRWISTRYGLYTRLPPAIISGLLVGPFLVAWLTEALGSNTIFGAFLVASSYPIRTACPSWSTSSKT